MKHVASLDGLRGVAVLLVVSFHYFPRGLAGPLSTVTSVGWMGVDVFFTLSGYLITSILYEQRSERQYLRNFYMRRVLRLFPLYYSVFLLALALTSLLHIQWRAGHIAFLLYGANLVLPVDGRLNWLGPFSLAHLWSLAVEEQFYLIWPWLVGSLLRKETLRRICVVGIVAAPLLRLALLHAGVGPWWIYQSLPTRMDSLLMGALLALVRLPSLQVARMGGAVALLVFALVAWEGHSAFFLARPMQGIGYSAAACVAASILVLSLNPSTLLHRICSWRVLRFYGRYSYGIYLWHFLFLKQFGALTNWVERQVMSPLFAGLLGFALILLCSTVVAMVSYRLIERPFLRAKLLFQSRHEVLVRTRRGETWM